MEAQVINKARWEKLGRILKPDPEIDCLLRARAPALPCLGMILACSTFM